MVICLRARISKRGSARGFKKIRCNNFVDQKYYPAKKINHFLKGPHTSPWLLFQIFSIMPLSTLSSSGIMQSVSGFFR
jgi:hypothetical protein